MLLRLPLALKALPERAPLALALTVLLALALAFPVAPPGRNSRIQNG